MFHAGRLWTHASKLIITRSLWASHTCSTCAEGHLPTVHSWHSPPLNSINQHFPFLTQTKGEHFLLDLFWWIILDKLSIFLISSRLRFQCFSPSATRSVPRRYSWSSPVKTELCLVWRKGRQFSSWAEYNCAFCLQGSLSWVYYLIISSERCRGRDAKDSLSTDTGMEPATGIWWAGSKASHAGLLCPLTLPGRVLSYWLQW